METDAIYQPRYDLARQIAGLYAAFPQVKAVAVAGSLAAKTASPESDIDLYVYQTAEIPVSDRLQLVSGLGALEMEIDNRFWELGDEWIDAASGIAVDLMYRSTEWIEDQLARSLDRFEASVGFSTCFWYNVLHSTPIFDPSGWYTSLQQKARKPYPAALRQAVVEKNHPLLRRNLSAYSKQLQKAVERRDLISVNHRTAAFLASYFDIIFAVNSLPNPGEKRLLAFAANTCKLLPENMAAQVDALIAASPRLDGSLMAALNNLVDALNVLLKAEGLLLAAEASVQ